MDQLVTTSFSETSIHEVFAIVSEATITKRPSQSATGIELKLINLSNWVTVHALFGFLIMLFLAAVTYYFRSDTFVIATIFFGLLVILLGFAILVLVILSAIPLLWKIRKAPYSPFLLLVQSACSFDLQYVNRLAVKTRLVVYAFHEQIRLFLLPFLECLNRRLML
ncbi:MAG: hypothetical protein HHJ09_09485 [Glaciimonas sp.]|nr:hypothetical protein [Glaciimonas sp.]